MPVVQSIELAREERIGGHGVAPKALNEAIARTAGALEWLRARHADGKLPLLRLPERRDDLDGIAKAAQRLAAGATDVVFLGTGGSSLGGQTLAQLAGHAVPGVGALRDGPRLHFMDNLDAESYAALLARAPLATTRFVAISKSGGTAETLMQTAAALTAMREAGLEAKISTTFLGLSEPASGRRNGLRDLLGGLLAAAVAGLDIAAVRAGAAAALAPVLDGKPAADVPVCVGAALAVTLAQARGKSISVLMAYADRLERFARWYVQLWAESLGKDGKGTTPIGALGPVDQHSQLQLFIAGPRDKLFTVVTVGAAGRGPRIDQKLAALAGEPDLGNKTMGDLVAAEGRATAETLAKNGCPVRTLHIERLDEAEEVSGRRGVRWVRVMRGLDPGIHVFTTRPQERRGWPGRARP